MQDAIQDALSRVQDNMRKGDLLATIEGCEELLATTPDHLTALHFLGMTSMLAGDTPRALNLYQRAHDLHPASQEVVLMLAAISAILGRLSDTVYFAKLALTLEPDPELAPWVPLEYRDPHTALQRVSLPRYVVDGSIEYQLGHYDETVRLTTMAIEVDKNDHAAFDLMGRALLRQGLVERAIAAMHAAIHMAPDNAEYRANLGEALIAKGAHGEGRALLAAAAADLPDSSELACRVVQAARRDPAATPASLEAAAAAWERVFATTPRTTPAAPGNRRPAVGYLINQDAVDNWLPVIEAVLSTHNQQRVDVHVFQQYPHDEKATVRLRRHCMSWRETFNIDDDTFAFMLRQLQLDVLVDLCGFTPGNRRAMLARGVARNQVAWLNESVETLGGVLDYAIGDETCETLAEGARLIVVPGGWMRYRGQALPVTEAEGPAARNGGAVTFGAVADLEGAAQAVPLWAEVLRRVPQSRLLLGNARGLDPWAAERFLELFAHWGLSTRIDLQTEDSTAVTADAFLSQVDVLLDSPLRNGTQSTADALREGVPVVTLAGATTPTRLGASLLTAAGHPEWVAADAGSYAAIAAGLALDPATLATTRAALRDGYAASALTDGAALAAALEATYLGLAQR